MDDERLRRTLPGRLAYLARTRGQRVALRHKTLGLWKEISWAQYYAATCAAARMLWESGVRPGDHVAILSDNRPQWLYADLAAQLIGARAVGVYQTSPATEVSYIVNHSHSSVLFCEDQEQVDKLMLLQDETPDLERIVVFEPRGTRGYDEPRLMAWDSFIEQGDKLLSEEPNFIEARLLELDPAEPSMVVYTSGTTGRPKGAMISSNNMIPAIDSVVEIYDATDQDIILSYLPLCHVAEKIYSVSLALAVGMVVHFGESIDTVQEDLREVSPTIFLGVPRIWEKMHAALLIRMQNSSPLKRALFGFFTRRSQEIAERRSKGFSNPSDGLVMRLGDLLVFRPLQERLGLRRCRIPTSGAAPIAPELLSWFRAVGVPVAEGYGMTELGGASHLNLPWEARLGTVGKVLPMLEHRIAEDGEILVRGASVFVGYLHNQAATAEMIDGEGWLHTGDIGEIDDGGYLRITGRKKEIIITAGGKNLSPERIENALKTSPFIKEVVSIGDRRKYVSALVQVEYETVGDWAQRRNISYTSYPDLVSKPEVIALVEQELRRCNEGLAPVEQVKRFELLPKELHEDDGELTPTQKVRRRVIAGKYEHLIEGMYGRK